MYIISTGVYIKAKSKSLSIDVYTVVERHSMPLCILESSRWLSGG